MVRRPLLRTIIAPLAILCLATSCADQPATTDEKKTEKAAPLRPAEHDLEHWLREYVTSTGVPPALKTRYVAARADLNSDGREEALVFLIDIPSCGSRGCTLLILTPTSSGWKLVTRTATLVPPIRLLPTKSHGWHDFSVLLAYAGGGWEQILSFDGKGYPADPREEALATPGYPLEVCSKVKCLRSSANTRLLMSYEYYDDPKNALPVFPETKTVSPPIAP